MQQWKGVNKKAGKKLRIKITAENDGIKSGKRLKRYF